MSKDKLTPKQKIFCEEYIIDWNASRAARDAGYSEKTAKDIGCENLAKPNIQAYIAEIQEDLQKQAGISRLSNLNILKEIAEETNTEEVQVKDKIKAVEVINKMLGFNAPEQSESKNTHEVKGIDPIKWLDE